MNSRLNRKSNRAYLLIELLVTVIILGLAICFIAQAFSSSMLAVKKANIYSKALLFSERILWDMRASQALGLMPAWEDFPKSVKEKENNLSLEANLDVFETPFSGLCEVFYKVSWRDFRTAGGFSFSTFMPVSGQQ